MKKILFLILILFFIPKSSFAEGVLGDGFLAKGSSYKVYIIENGIKRWIKDQETFFGFGFLWKNIRYVSDDILDLYPEGLPIDNTLRYPDGVLIRQEGDFKVYIIKNGYKSWIKNPETFNNLGLHWDNIFELKKEFFVKIRETVPTIQKEKIKRPNTVFLKTPEPVIENIYADFEFSAFYEDGDIVFDTFLEGIDKTWKSTRSQKRSFTLPKKSQKYRFFVRARDTKAGVDLTPAKFEFIVKISPLFSDVSIYSVRLDKKDVKKQYLILRNNSKIPIDITGWSIQSEKEKSSYVIPKAKKIPNHPYFQEEVNIKLAPRQRAILSFSKSPIGESFLTNKCIGYLQNNFDFYPYLQRQCPLPDRNEAEKISPYCRKVVSSLYSCQEPNLNDFLLDNQCREYLRDFNYTQCVNKNKNFYDFYKDEWRVYLGLSSSVFLQNHDKILLRDRNGLVVSIYKY